MECFECLNCRQGQSTYYCPSKDQFVINKGESFIEKNRSGWKKGDPVYEIRRRKIRKEKDIV